MQASARSFFRVFFLAATVAFLPRPGSDGKLLACPVFDGLSAAGSRLIVPPVTGKVVCLRAGEGDS